MNDGRSTSSISYQNRTLGCGGGKEGKVLELFWRADKFLLKKKKSQKDPQNWRDEKWQLPISVNGDKLQGEEEQFDDNQLKMSTRWWSTHILVIEWIF